MTKKVGSFMFNRILKYICFVVCLSLPLYLCAQKPSDILQQHLSAFHTMTANFHQIVTSSDGTVLQDSNGKVSIVRPGKFKWVTENPLKQVIITNGQKVFLYDPDLKQVVIRKLSTSVGKMPILLLTQSHVYLKQNFEISQLPSDAQSLKFKLIPKDQNEMFDKIIVVFKHEKINEIILASQLGQKTLLQFNQVKLNTKIDDSLFSFKAPKGVDVVTE